MYEVLKAGGLHKRRSELDAKARRGSYTMEDIFLSYIAGMDTFALGLKAAAKIIEDGRLDKFVDDRYASWTTGIGADIIAGKADMETLRSMQLRRAKLLTHFLAADRNIWRAFSIRSCSIFKQGRAPAPISAIIRGSGFFVQKRAEFFFAPLFAFFITFLFLRVPAAPVHTVRSPQQTS